MREQQRKPKHLRPTVYTLNYLRRVPGSVLVEQGKTRLLCAATVEEKTAPFLKNTGKGWITAEYAMLPAASGNERIARERLKTNSRHTEIQRFLGRALRSAINLSDIGEMTITIDADVIQADGSTRCAAVNGGLLALYLALRYMVFEQLIANFPPFQFLAAVSLGRKDNEILVDLDYEEDSAADMDVNIVSSEQGEIIQVQALGEGQPVPAEIFQEMIKIGIEKNLEIITSQKAALREAGIEL